MRSTGFFGRNWSTLRPFLPARSWIRMAGVSFTAFVGGLCESLVLVLITLTADGLIRQAQTVELGPLTMSQIQAVGLAVALVVGRLVMTTISAFQGASISAVTMKNAQAALLTSYLGSSHGMRSSRRIGDLSVVAVTNGRFVGDMTSGFIMIATGACGLIAFGGTSLSVNPVASLLIAAVGGLLIAALRPLRTRSKLASRRLADTARDLGTGMTEVETVHREIEIFDAAQPVSDAIEPSINLNERRYQRVRFLANAVPQVFQATMLGAAVLSLVLVVRNPDAVDLASVGAVVLLLVRAMSSSQQIVLAHQRVIEYGAYTQALGELVEDLDQDRPEFGDAQPTHLTPVRFENVRFSYDGETDVLHGIDLELRLGDLVGVVGPSGAGKSTLVELLLRLRRPTAGGIYADSTPWDQVDPAVYAERVAFVPQNPALISGTVAENVAFFRDVDESRIKDVLRQVNLADEVDRLPEGIHTPLGPDDRSLSGGQRQRLTIARALAGDPEILILDEPTSALDAISEQAIRETLDILRHERLVLIVAHRYSTLRSCSRILVLREGTIEVDASPEEVAERSGFFRTMVGETVQ